MRSCSHGASSAPFLPHTSQQTSSRPRWLLLQASQACAATRDAHRGSGKASLMVWRAAALTGTSMGGSTCVMVMRSGAHAPRQRLPSQLAVFDHTLLMGTSRHTVTDCSVALFDWLPSRLLRVARTSQRTGHAGSHSSSSARFVPPGSSSCTWLPSRLLCVTHMSSGASSTEPRPHHAIS